MKALVHSTPWHASLAMVALLFVLIFTVIVAMVSSFFFGKILGPFLAHTLPHKR